MYGLGILSPRHTELAGFPHALRGVVYFSSVSMLEIGAVRLSFYERQLRRNALKI